MVSFGLTKLNLEEAKAEVANRGNGALLTEGGNGSFIYTHAASSQASSVPHAGSGAGSGVAPSGPSLLAASTVSAIERYLHTQLLEHESSLGLPTAPTAASKPSRARRQTKRPALNIRKIQELATRAQRRSEKQTNAHAPSGPTTVAAAAADSSRSPHSPPRRSSSFSITALLNLEQSGSAGAGPRAPPQMTTSTPPPIPIVHHLRAQLEDGY